MLIPYWQRIIGLYLYMLPWSDALPFGWNLFGEFPILKWLAAPTLPILILEKTIPFGGLLLFLGLFLGVVRNTNIPYFIRFNGLQAILINILIILINYIFQIFSRPLEPNLIIRTFSSTIFISFLTLVIYAVIECLRGNEPDLPAITNAVKMQI